MVYHIKWGDFVKSSYVTGSRVTFLGDRVLFDNPLMSPSFPITSWRSKTNFQGDRSQPELPLLQRGTTYRLKLVAKTTPANSLYIKVTYFDRLGEEVGFDTLKDDSWLFTYPTRAFSYQIELINAGCTALDFSHLLLIEGDDVTVDDVDLTDLAVYFPKENTQLNVLFLEPQSLQGTDLPMDLLRKLGNLVIVGDRYAAESFYLANYFEERLSRHLWFYYDNHLTDINFIGYGPVGNLACLYYATKFNSKIYINGMLEQKSYYKEEIVKRKIPTDASVDHLFQRLTYINNVTYYGNNFNHSDFDLIRGLFDTSSQLKQLPLLAQG